MRLKDKCRKQKAEIERLWKMVEWPPKAKAVKGGIVVVSKAFSMAQLHAARDAEIIIDEELSDLKDALMQRVYGKGATA